MFMQELPGAKASKGTSRVLIVPTGSMDLSAMTCHIPQIHDFEMPHNSKPDPYSESRLRCDCVEHLRQACDRLLDRYGKKCVNVGNNAKDELPYPARWSRPSRSKLDDEEVDKGVLHFLPSGFLWQSEEQREDGTANKIYVPLNEGQDHKDTPLADGIELVSSEGSASLHITGVQYSLVHKEQFKQDPVSGGLPRNDITPATVRRLEKHNATSTRIVDSDLLVFGGLPASEQEQIEQYISDHYPEIANGTNKEKSNEKSNERTKQQESHDMLEKKPGRIKGKSIPPKREILDYDENVPSSNTRSRKRKVISN